MAILATANKIIAVKRANASSVQAPIPILFLTNGGLWLKTYCGSVSLYAASVVR